MLLAAVVLLAAAVLLAGGSSRAICEPVLGSLVSPGYMQLFDYSNIIIQSNRMIAISLIEVQQNLVCIRKIARYLDFVHMAPDESDTQNVSFNFTPHREWRSKSFKYLICGSGWFHAKAARWKNRQKPTTSQSMVVYLQGCRYHRIIREDTKEDWGSGGWKSPSRVKGRNPGRWSPRS